MNINRKIYVAMATDDNYAVHLAVAVYSIMVNLSEGYDLCIYILNQKISDENKEKILQIKEITRDFDVKFLEIDLKNFKKLKYTRSAYISPISAGRFLLPETLSYLDKCIYLDVDLIVRQDLAELWNIEMMDHSIGAVEEPAARNRNKILNILDEYSHFNSGVLLLNLKKLREINLKEKALQILDYEKKITTGDQDILNIIFAGQWLVLPIKWNVTVSMCYMHDDSLYYKYSDIEVESSLHDPAICHFTEEKKPDSYLCRHSYRKDYIKYRKMISWGDFSLKDVNFKSLLLRQYWNLKDILYFLKKFIKRNPKLFMFLRQIKRNIMAILKIKRSNGEK